MAAIKANDMAAARKIVDAIEADAATPRDMQKQVAMVSALVASATKLEAPAAKAQ